MYAFRDTNDVGTGLSLPSEAMSYNGVYLENVIPGYRTLSVSGRELMSKEITDRSVPGVDGSEWLSERYPSRTITVRYQLIAKSNKAFRDAYNELNRILDAEQVKIIFADEADKYFIGTKSTNKDVSPGLNSVIGEISIYCTDPRKYSSVIKQVTAIEDEDGVLIATIDNQGNLPCALNYEVVHAVETGALSIVSEYGAMQFGYLTDPDTEVRTKSQVLFNYTNYTQMINGGVVNNGGSTIPQQGNFKSVNGYLGINSIDNRAGYHGPALTIPIPADSSGVTGAENFTLTCRFRAEATKIKQTGILQVAVSDANKKIMCKFNVNNGSTGNSTATLFMSGVVNSSNASAPDFHKLTFPLTNKGYYNDAQGWMTIRKSGSLIEFDFAGKKYSRRFSEIANTKARYVTIQLGKNGNNAIIPTLYCKRVQFRKDNVSYIYDIPNRYQPGTTCRIDGETGKYYVNGNFRPGDEILGTNYFKAPPGETKIQIGVSEWTETNPAVTVTYREAWI